MKIESVVTEWSLSVDYNGIMMIKHRNQYLRDVIKQLKGG